MFSQEIYRLQATDWIAQHLFLATHSDQYTFRKDRVERWVDAARKEVLPLTPLDGKRIKLVDDQLSDAVRFKDKPEDWPYVRPHHANQMDDETIPLFTEGANGVNSVDSVEDPYCRHATGVWEWTSYRYMHPAPLGHYGEQLGPGWSNYMDHGFPLKETPVQEFQW
jgi:hypothetical protein